LVAHDAGAVPSIVSAASTAMHRRALIFMLVPPPQLVRSVLCRAFRLLPPESPDDP
jgi:hypothetical protein